MNHVKSKKHLEAQEAFDKRGDINKEELTNNRKNRRIEREEAEKQRQQELQEEMEDDEDVEEVDSDEWDEDEGRPQLLLSCLTSCISTAILTLVDNM